SQQAATRNRGKAIVNSPPPIYYQEPFMVVEDDKMSNDKEIDKLMALIYLSFKKIYKPSNNNLRTSSNTSRAIQDSSLRISRGVGECQKLKRAKDAAYHKENMLLYQELEAHYLYMAQIQEVTLDAADNSGPIFYTEPLQKIDRNDDDDDHANEHDLLASLIEKLKCEIDDSKNHLKKFQAELDRHNDVKYASKMEIDCAKAKGDLMSYKMEFEKPSNRYTQKINDLNQTISEMKKELFAHQETIFILSQHKEAQIKFHKTQMKKELFAHQETIFIPSQHKEAQIKFHKTREDKELDKVIDLENKVKVLDNIVYKTGQSVQTMNMLNQKGMDESIPYDQKCKSSKELFKIKRSGATIFDGVKRCKQTIAKRTYFGHIDPFIQNTIEGNFCSKIRRINADLENFHLCLKEEMVADLRYFNSLELEVVSLKSQLETQKTQFLIEIDRLLREYYYAGHMNAILGVYTELDEVTNLQCDYLETLEKCECLEKELSKSKMMSKSFEALQKHAINLELDLQQCQEKIKMTHISKKNSQKNFAKNMNNTLKFRT
nr:hypothetical protein [Tanacetum cinerariifolium]